MIEGVRRGIGKLFGRGETFDKKKLETIGGRSNAGTVDTKYLQNPPTVDTDALLRENLRREQLSAAERLKLEASDPKLAKAIGSKVKENLESSDKIDMFHKVWVSTKDLLFFRRPKTSTTKLGSIGAGAAIGGFVGSLFLGFGAIPGAFIGASLAFVASDYVTKRAEVFEKERYRDLSKSTTAALRDKFGITTETANLMGAYLYNRIKNGQDPMQNARLKELFEKGIENADENSLGKLFQFFISEVGQLNLEFEALKKKIKSDIKGNTKEEREKNYKEAIAKSAEANAIKNDMGAVIDILNRIRKDTKGIYNQKFTNEILDVTYKSDAKKPNFEKKQDSYFQPSEQDRLVFSGTLNNHESFMADMMIRNVKLMQEENKDGSIFKIHPVVFIGNQNETAVIRMIKTDRTPPAELQINVTLDKANGKYTITCPTATNTEDAWLVIEKLFGDSPNYGVFNKQSTTSTISEISIPSSTPSNAAGNVITDVGNNNNKKPPFTTAQVLHNEATTPAYILMNIKVKELNEIIKHNGFQNVIVAPDRNDKYGKLIFLSVPIDLENIIMVANAVKDAKPNAMCLETSKGIKSHVDGVFSNAAVKKDAQSQLKWKSPFTFSGRQTK